MNKPYLSRIWMSIAMVMTLLVEAGCGGGVGSGGTGIVSGDVTKGPLSTATVTAYAIASGQRDLQIGTATTDANGHYSMTIGGYAGSVMIQVSGGSFTEESTGSAASMAGADVMTVVIPTVAAGANTSGIQITPITSMAQVLAQKKVGGMIDANITLSNTAMGQYFSVNDIVHVQPMNPLLPGSGAAASADARKYGIALAGMSQLAKISLNMVNTSALVSAMMSDASDGMMDGKNGSAQISMAMGGMMGNMMPATAGTSDLATAMTSFMSNLAANKSGVTATDPDVAAMVQKLSSSNGRI